MIKPRSENKEYSSPNCTFFVSKNKKLKKKLKIKLNEYDVIT